MKILQNCKNKMKEMKKKKAWKTLIFRAFSMKREK